MTGDSGLQPERTQLAWHRTALVATGCALLLLHVAAHHGWTITTVLPATLLAASALATVVSGRRVNRPILVGLVGFLVTSACVSSIPLVLFGR